MKMDQKQTYIYSFRFHIFFFEISIKNFDMKTSSNITEYKQSEYGNGHLS